MTLATRTFGEIKTAVQSRGQYENSSDITSTLLGDFVNEAIQELYDMLVQKWQDLYVTVGSPFSTVANTEAYDLDTIAPNFYKLRKVESLVSGTAGQASARWRRLYPHDLEASHVYTGSVAAKGYRYRLQG